MGKRVIKGEISGLWTIEFEDDSFATKEFFESFSKYICRIDSLEEYAELIAVNMATGSAGSWIDGVGPVNVILEEIEIYDSEGPVGKAKYDDGDWDCFAERERVVD